MAPHRAWTQVLAALLLLVVAAAQHDGKSVVASLRAKWEVCVAS